MLSYDSGANALYVSLRDPLGERVARTAVIGEGTSVDLDRHGRVLGIEVLGPGYGWPLAAILREYEVSDEDAAMLMAGYPFACSMEVA